MTERGLFETAAPAGARRLRRTAGWIFVGLIVFAPLNFGSTRAGGPEILTAGCAVAVLAWALSLIAGARAQVPLMAAAGATLLTIAALPWILGLASLTPVAPFTQLHFAHVAARWPYSIVWLGPAHALPFILALAASTLALIDLARSPFWLLAFGLALTLTAVAVGILALLQNYTHAGGIYWRHDGHMPTNFCGTFFHHTAAGAYFNTAWPLAAALTALAWNRPHAAGSVPVLAGMGLFATIVLLAAHGSHVSRFPQLAALLVAPFLLRGLRLSRPPRWLVGAGAVVAVVLLVLVAGRAGQIAERWQSIFEGAPVGTTPTRLPESAWPALIRDDLFIPHTSHVGWFGDRGESWRTALRSIVDRPFTGHGPGNWMGAASQHTDDPFVRTFFQFLQFTHQDVLQSAVEWGLPATLGWWGLLAGALVAVFRARHWLSERHRQLGIAAACGLAAVLLQAQIDFPLQIPAVAFNVVILAALGWAGATTLSAPPKTILS